MYIKYMPTHTKSKSHSKKSKKLIHKLKRERDTLQDTVHDNDMTHEKLIELLGVACKYCNNLENHLKIKGYSRKNIEDIKDSSVGSI